MSCSELKKSDVRLSKMTKKNITIEETYALAVQNHKKNNLKLAEELYEEILKINLHHLLNILLFLLCLCIKEHVNKV